MLRTLMRLLESEGAPGNAERDRFENAILEGDRGVLLVLRAVKEMGWNAPSLPTPDDAYYGERLRDDDAARIAAFVASKAGELGVAPGEPLHAALQATVEVVSVIGANARMKAEHPRTSLRRYRQLYFVQQKGVACYAVIRQHPDLVRDHEQYRVDLRYWIHGAARRVHSVGGRFKGSLVGDGRRIRLPLTEGGRQEVAAIVGEMTSMLQVQLPDLRHGGYTSETLRWNALSSDDSLAIQNEALVAAGGLDCRQFRHTWFVLYESLWFAAVHACVRNLDGQRLFDACALYAESGTSENAGLQ